jgi:hypothetical protein
VHAIQPDYSCVSRRYRQPGQLRRPLFNVCGEVVALTGYQPRVNTHDAGNLAHGGRPV